MLADAVALLALLDELADRRQLALTLAQRVALRRPDEEEVPAARPVLHSLPVHTWKEYGNVELKPCAEVLLTLKAAETMIGLGLMPLLSMKGSDRVRVGAFQSIAKPPAPLEGRWR